MPLRIDKLHERYHFQQKTTTVGNTVSILSMVVVKLNRMQRYLMDNYQSEFI